ncbi:MAG TPA: head maturation protease, ClpP-related [Phycisphaerae bacterium]|nr:head maturation protease, ClpP-related [Phycisphaerae bacterium]HUX03277.1 head maturation protease, ClpP-related [Phycisphaerae bacterium]
MIAIASSSSTSGKAPLAAAEWPSWAHIEGQVLTLDFYEAIGEWFGGIGAREVVRVLREAKDVTRIVVHLNCAGGEVFDGVAIYNALAGHGARVEVEIDGMALSIASVIAMAGDIIRIAENAIMMIHDPWQIVSGTADEIREYADQLDRIKNMIVATYAARTGLEESEIAAMMKAETWMDAQEALEKGFATEIVEAKRVAACAADPRWFHNMPVALADRLRFITAEIRPKTAKEKLMAGKKSDEEKAAEEKAAAEKAAADKAAEDKAAEEKAAADKAAEDKAAADKAAEDKAAEEKAAADKAAEDKAAADKVAEEKAAAEKAAVEKIAADKAAEAAVQARAECKKYVEAFGGKGGEWFAAGKTFTEAQALQAEDLKAENARQAKEIERLGKAARAARGEEAPVTFVADGAGTGPDVSGLAGKIGENAAKVAGSIKFQKKGK